MLSEAAKTLEHASAEVNAAAEATAVSDQLSNENQAIDVARVAQQAAIAAPDDAEAKMKAAAALKAATDQICEDLQNVHHVFVFNPGEHDKLLNVVFDPNTAMQVQGSFTGNPAWIPAIPGIPLECNEQEKFIVQWDVSLTSSSGVVFCLGVIGDMDKKWYFTNTKSMNDLRVVQTFDNFFNSGDVVRVSLERVRQTNQCTLTATNLTMNEMHTLEFVCPDLLCPVVCISDPSQIYRMQSVAQTTEEDEWDIAIKQFPATSIKQPELTWKNLRWWTSLFTGGGKSKMTRKKKNGNANSTRRKFKHANMKTNRMRKKLHTHKKIRMTLKNKNK